MVVKKFITSEKQTKVVIEMESNGSYTVYESGTDWARLVLNNVWSLDWLIDTLHMQYMPEKLMEAKGAW